MPAIRQYLLTVTAAALLCAIINTVSGPKGAAKAVLKLLSGVFLALSVVSPWLDIGQLDLAGYADTLQTEAADAAILGKSMAQDYAGHIITENTAAYILEKAESLGLDIQADVSLDGLVPCAVNIKGTVSPYAKEILKEHIEEHLGIAEEFQTWE